MPGTSEQRPDPTDAARAAGPARRVSVDPGGPVLVEGPVEALLDDGTLVRSDRFMVALCTCRRSRTYPWCDTSHRRRVRPAPAPDGTEDTAAASHESSGSNGSNERNSR
ncbi:CDGSH iron-sulfur domain-containing protein [Streptomyces sp. NPDC091268]|uniref:CDGSH iron-sulfur domain-containing protein n=1 Tax=Streptomyces sp. NPDC091268 TaxID=3365979 RepID=UPI00381509A5